MASFWLIAVPSEDGREKTWQKLQDRTARESTNFKFAVPDLRVGTLDSLLELSDDLAKIDSYVESVVHKLERQLCDLNPDETLTVNGVSLEQFMTKFLWDPAKYNLKNSLRDLTSAISEEVTKIDEELRLKSSEYQTLKGALAAVKRKAGGNLMQRNLADVINKDHFVESENLTTLLVVVPKFMSREFLTTYESLTDFVVPRSAQKIAEDNEYELYRIIVFKRVADDYKNAAREKKYIVRDFKYDAVELEQSKGEKSRLELQVEKEWASLVRWCRTVFSEVFKAWIHLKAVRVFVESVLRYGLPANFQAYLMKPQKKSEKRLRESLQQLYGHLGSGSNTDQEKEPASQEFFAPYVYLPVTPSIATD
mmetsp:Transcript_7463/g.11870  ORF Transcript_7463/g.11870 Transcript_7463/m.11870 type:complete len:366 (-) Transcript_7463:419-1516(-)